jgi:hypothetical protein
MPPSRRVLPTYLRVLLGLGLLASCTCYQPGTTGSTESYPFHVAERDYLIVLPVGSEVEQAPDRVWLRIASEERTGPSIRLRHGGEGSYDRSRQLANGARLNYHSSQAEGGSAGAQFVLEGVLQIDGIELTVECFMQGEWPVVPCADWCGEYLGTMRSEPAEDGRAAAQMGAAADR